MAGRLLAVSDLHVGYPENRAYADALSPEDPGDWLIVAGDVGETFADVGLVLASLANRFAKVIWTPGNQPMETPADLAVPLTGNAKLVMQIHYHPAGLAHAPDRTSIDLRTSNVWPRKMYFVGAFGNAVAAPQLLPDPEDRTSSPEFRIPANSADHVEHMRVTVVATGLSRPGQQRRTAPPLQVLRTGTDNAPINVPTVNNAVGGPGAIVTREMLASGAQQPDYGGLAVPSVWRTNRTQAAAKVDALSSGGMDDFEIPAFLRKQAD